MELGLKKNDLRLSPYDPSWEKAFMNIKKQIIDCTALKPDRIQHIGSTSIVGMPAKPIIDIMVGIDSLKQIDAKLFTQLKEAGFLRLKVEKPDEIVLARFTDKSYSVKTHFIHLVEKDSKKWNDLLFFRNHLNQNSQAKEAYKELKQELVVQPGMEIQSYTEICQRYFESE
ncbi:GrpB family protein [Marinilactibacillus sp. Marseille-P9653]|uniref:GrpB family protein n=1 Tax=Marinilactibacillus sp. Marseille-P9653 TaxID=2866583 RepID=UPI001CE3EC6D|nr:GrpB family protein [Marinilactibacillus sp. Marseille-P9653]